MTANNGDSCNVRLGIKNGIRKSIFIGIAVILLSWLSLSGIASSPTQEAEATANNKMLASMFAQTSSNKDLRSIQYTTTTTKSYEPIPCAGSCLPVWSEAHLINGVGNNNYWYQCGVRYNQNTSQWEVWFQWFTSGGGWQDVVSSTKPPANTTVTLKLGVPAYTGASNVQCEAYWGSTGVILGSTSSASYFKRTAALDNGRHTSVLSEYTRSSVSASVPQVYNKVALIDTSNTSVSLTQVNQVIDDGIPSHPTGFSGVSSLPKTYSYYSHTVSTNTASKVTTTTP